MPARRPAARKKQSVSVPFNAGRGLMRKDVGRRPHRADVSVPFNAGRGLMQNEENRLLGASNCFSTLQCGSWIDARRRNLLGRRSHVFQYPSMRVVD